MRETDYDGALTATYDNLWRNTSGMSSSTQYSSSALDPTYVNKTGTTYYALVSSRDLSATTPTNCARRACAG